MHGATFTLIKQPMECAAIPCMHEVSFGIYSFCELYATWLAHDANEICRYACMLHDHAAGRHTQLL